MHIRIALRANLEFEPAKIGFIMATKLGTTDKNFVAATKNFASATKCFVDRTKYFVVLTKYFCYPYFDPVSYTHLTLPTNREV